MAVNNFLCLTAINQSPWQIAVASGWESEGLGFESRRLQAAFDPGLLKK